MMFFGGNIDNPKADDFTGRGSAYVELSGDERYVFAKRGEGSGGLANFADMMKDSEFCYSPLGSHGGDSGDG